jgi:hypothetical protein
MHPEKFSDHAELHNYAERHGLEYLWEGTQAFERRKRTLPPEQFEICEARTHRGMRNVRCWHRNAYSSLFSSLFFRLPPNKFLQISQDLS